MNEQSKQLTFLEKIESGQVHMKSKTFWRLQSALRVGGMLLAVLLAIFITSFIFYQLQIHGILFLPQFGKRGLYDLLVSLPWLIGAAAALCVALFITLSKHFALTYRHPLIYTFGGSLLLVALGSALVQYLGIHPYLHRPGMPMKQRGFTSKLYGRPSGRGFILKITDLQNNVLVLQNLENESFFISLPNQDLEDPRFHLGNWILIDGRLAAPTITPFFVKVVPPPFR